MIVGSHIVERENELPDIVPWPLFTVPHTHGHTLKNKVNNKNRKSQELISSEQAQYSRKDSFNTLHVPNSRKHLKHKPSSARHLQTLEYLNKEKVPAI